ncbi:hypothetical protein UF75_3120 [Desulfosporosinus sp. I2]|uniref:hypothetical protein n=1 Tax=Desulfosporosinus sp. I2 TaxID=1617025 RepID=UPI00061E8B31|nr:hypothetical protein [Desulfosporosinus sp. I2]KJR46508.1 hypothetical protein UF75_3120 [Desulfosporosinus sp. I2]
MGETGLINGIGWLTGFLIEQERKASRNININKVTRPGAVFTLYLPSSEQA